ncbi:NAD-dependent succinate-semialdehyde dehydrogenase [Planotetraspora sp. A-T 1434]|uniref:NAD-dependent succinate-semialdehyde dehydrogenase n=1 Tax=Planotetraspora sp. A-T 1434 TaxID=2979219 RepID=UPI0021C17367|nr:NAD-dependent succinate-semialdehyde dehydrogenase [Planotetraspora sp. A-T 1434]MCT9934460.1 NAD-dependent succinate-semialdehyde dehydrogenase [Planotetraspora sp. A-T 1434]
MTSETQGRTETPIQTRTIDTVNPSTGRPLRSYPAFSEEQIDQALADAYGAARAWRGVAVEERARRLGAVGGVLRSRREELARLITAEMGKPLPEALAEIDKCAWQCDQYATSGAELLKPEHIETAAESSYIVYEPLGVVLAVMPWNFPFWQLFRFAVPAMLAGNTVLLKHSPNVTGSALAIEEVFTAELPRGVLRTLVVHESDVPAVADRLIADSRIAAVTLTGSTRAGGHVAAAAGKALKKSVLELGGSDPFVVLADADLRTAAVHAAKSRLMCAGQTCIAAKRVIVHADVADEFERLFVDAIAAATVGDPTAEGTSVGPLARADLLDHLEHQVRESVAQGAKVLCGGERIDREGNFFAPTVLTNVTRDMPVFSEETFGPVAALIRVQDDEEAIAVANDTEYGLAASVWSRDVEHALAVGGRIESGCLFVNSFVSSDPRVPFGGIKRSGYGRELGAAGVREFTNVRSVWIAPTAAQQPTAAATE